ncbi:hypothetical protein GGR53DRAFT_36476 [Hypoxylon sp. FL1150]|nr:hypothetical protein GGR53DRAFT_36476 [Hypoxylon sp. FL1150]
MESLRRQLHETQDALDKKTIQLRQLKVELTEAQTKWQTERQSYVARLRELVKEITRLQELQEENQDEYRTSAQKALLGGSGDRVTALAPGGDMEKLELTIDQRRQAELKYKCIKDELAEKTKLCEDLQRQVRAQSGVPGILPDLTDDQVVAGWKKLRGQIRDLSARNFAMPQPISDEEEEGYNQLSGNWRAYIFRPELTSYLIQSLVWRSLVIFLFEKYCRVWGREYGTAAHKLGGFFMSTVPDKQFQEWRMTTAALFDKACEYDVNVLSEVELRMCSNLSQFTKGTGSEEAVRKAVKEIVTTAAELSAIFHCTQFVPLMTNTPRSSLTHGFPLQVHTMELKARQQAINPNMTVDMIVSPCLLKKDVEYIVLVKAEVIC